MAEVEYPARPKFYANKVTRLLFKTAAANDLGSDVCYLVTQIAHQEDASRYAGPVTFWNEQLMAICGFKNVRALDRARASAMKAGWLVYRHGGKGKVGKYFTLIPDKFVSYEDGAIDETNIHAELTPAMEVTTPVATETPDKRQDNARETPENSQTNAEETPEKCLTFLPNPLPNPHPNTNTPQPLEGELPGVVLGKQKREKARKACPEDPTCGLAIPTSLATPQFIEAWAIWIQHHHERRTSPTPTAVGQQLKKCEKWGLARAVAAIEHSVAGNYTGLFEDNSGGGNVNGRQVGFGKSPRGGAQAIGPGQRYDAEAAAGRGVDDF